MSLKQQIRTMLFRLHNGAYKIRWGLSVVGAWATVRGTARLITMRLLRPKRANVRLRSGAVLEFDYPSQFPPVLVLFGELIDPEFSLLKRISRPDWVVADVGAAIGQFTLFASMLPCTMVHAFEPSGGNVATLRRNVERNGVSDRVRIHQLALSSADGESTFETTEKTWVSRLSRGSEKGGEAVSVRTLAGELRRLKVGHLNVLKVNVAGYEPEVLEGAEPFLADGRADILILLLGLPSLRWYETIANHGYRFFYYHPAQNILYEVTAFDESSVLHHRPSPARHIIAIRSSAIDAGIVAAIQIRRL